MAVMTKQVVAQVPFLRKYTDKEKDNLANYAAKLFTLNVFYDVNKRIIKNPVDIEEGTEGIFGVMCHAQSAAREIQSLCLRNYQSVQ